MEELEYKYVVSIKFKSANKAYNFCTNDSTITYGDYVVVETLRGLEIGEVISDVRDIQMHTNNIPLKPILRIANAQDRRDYQRNLEDAKEAMKICAQEIAKLNLDMHLISAEYTLDRSKISFVYMADERVDFRELFKHTIF